MAFCAKCGAQLAAGATFCSSCGAAQGAGSGGGGPAAAAGTGLEENVAGLICYVLGLLTGIVFFVIDKRPFVRFHAAQSMVVFGALFIIYIALNIFLSMSWMMGAATGVMGSLLHFLFGTLIWLISLVVWVLCMVKAYQHERFKLPIVGDIAENIAGK